MLRVKVCGVTRVEDALAAVDAGADAIGLNFYVKSPRRVAEDRAREVADALRGRALVVGVFVNEAPARITELVERIGLDAVQLHGDEPPSDLAGLPDGIPVIRAVRYGDAGLAPLLSYLEGCPSMGGGVSAVLVDAPAQAQGGEYGGTGRPADWGRLANEKHLLGAMPLILAGGLRPENVAGAIAAVGPYGVDTASGVELSPGEKDHERIKAFVAAARAELVRSRA